ncbi:MAG: exonuclease domain-containing protein [Desulfobacteraceae bacterium]|jgi:DNA polymerase-3 subunit epsilon
MRDDNKFGWFVIVSLLFSLVVMYSICFLFWNSLSLEEKRKFIVFLNNYISFIFSMAFLLFAIFGLFLDWVFRIYILPINKITEEITLIQSVNPSYRITAEGSRDIIRLVNNINTMANDNENIQNRVSAKIESALNKIEEEKDIFAAILSELPQGVLICNTEGRVLFYNKQALNFLTKNVNIETPTPDPFIGLGRSIFNIVDKSLIVHALNEIDEKMSRQDPNLATHFVLSGHEGRLIRVQVAPIVRKPNVVAGFILVVIDFTNELASNSQQTKLLQTLSRGIRSSLAGIRSAIEAIMDYPEMTPALRAEFNRIIHGETLKIEDVMSQAYEELAGYFKSNWPLVPTLLVDILEVIRKKTAKRLQISMKIDVAVDDITIQVDSYLFIQIMLFLQKQLHDHMGCSEFIFRVEGNDKFVNIDLIWRGPSISMDFLHQLEKQYLYVEENGVPITLKDAIGHHEGEIWPHVQDGCEENAIRLMLPSFHKQVKDKNDRFSILLTSRPEFYDFDLFNQSGQTPDLNNRLLRELTYTVFDTETTGLDPKGGDEIISIGAVRIVNGRILREEFFDHFVDPQRNVPEKSIQIHGIKPHMLEGQPKIDVVLAHFYRFCEDTILVGHNVAFDMSMFQIKEEETGIIFDQPVLDTMLLSDVIHPSYKDHTIEAIAKRLGVNIFGRHTALGDAIVTGEMFLKIIPLLEKVGIRTLEEARIASQKTYHARLKY